MRLRRDRQIEALGNDAVLDALRVDALEKRVKELEDRLAEAGRRALFHADQAATDDAPTLRRYAGEWLADVGRALLFDPETP